MIFKPLGFRVFAKRKEDWGSQIIQRSHTPEKTSLEATVVGIGTGVTTVKEGDHIVIARYGQYEPPPFDDDKTKKYKDCVIVNEDEILGIIQKGEGDS